MRVSLLHNSHSGSKDHTADEIVETIRHFGHEIVAVAHSLEELGAGLKRDAPDLIAIAGGDGTVSRTACAFAGSPVPFAILPHGTANNTALSLGVPDSVEAIVASWALARERPFDLIEATTNGRSRLLAEAGGWGVFPQVMVESKRRQEDEGAERSLAAERQLFLEIAQHARPHRYEVTLNGVDLSGDYLLVEICNLPCLGPQLELSPTSSPEDGLIEVVLWTERERECLCRALETGLSPVNAPEVRRGDRVSVRASDTVRHADGELVELGDAVHGAVHFSVRRAAVRYRV
jgi:diacylglycerol kinase family enzyme